MFRRPYPSAALAVLSLVSVAAAAQQPAGDDLARIRDEGLNRSQVMETAQYLTDIIGPRLTGSPQCRRANEWTRDRLASWGLSAKLEPWAPFGKGWSLKRFSASLVEPQSVPLIAAPKAWSPGTPGAITAPVVYLEAKTEADLERYRGKLKGAIVLTAAPREPKPHFEPRATRKSDKQLLELADASASGTGGRRRGAPTAEQRAQRALAARTLRLVHEEGVAALVEPSRGGDDAARPSDGGTLFVTQGTVPQPLTADGTPDAARRVSIWARDAPPTVPQVVLSVEQYNRFVRMLRAGEKLTMSLDLAVELHPDPFLANTIAEIPGTDPNGEIVMLGAHLDSWHTGTGATDNAAGVAACMEAARILKTLGIRPRRTIRVALWTGEEQGLLGSRAYVAEHFGKLETPPGSRVPRVVPGPEFEKISAYYNLDNGSGKIRGIYLQGNEALRPLFREWLGPFRDLEASTISAISVRSTDHVPFDALGIPAFQFIQDDLEYPTRTHHSNQDVFDRLQAEDLKQASTLLATFVYRTAMQEERLPRKPLPAR